MTPHPLSALSLCVAWGLLCFHYSPYLGMVSVLWGTLCSEVNTAKCRNIDAWPALRQHRNRVILLLPQTLRLKLLLSVT